jgi:uncharacterized protein YrzB (UPF0473 family)
MAEQETNWITLVDEDGHEHRFNLLNVLEVDGLKYAVMLPEVPQDEEEDEEAVIFRIDTDEAGEEVLVDIEDDQEFAKVCEVLEDMYQEDEEEPEEQ